MSWKRNGDNPFQTPGMGAGMSMGPPNGGGPPQGMYYDDNNSYNEPPGRGPPQSGGYGFGGNDRYQNQHPPRQQQQQQGYQSPLDAEVDLVLNEIKSELMSLDSIASFDTYRNIRRVMNTEITKLENNVDPEWIELDVEKEIKLVKKVLIPQYRYPRFNFVGKILGPKAQTLQNLAKRFKCHVYVLGRGSTRDRAKEQELLGSGDPNYAHYSGPLHVKIETTATPDVAYQRVAGVLGVLKQLLEPVRDTYIEGITPLPESGADEPEKNDTDSDNANPSQNATSEPSFDKPPRENSNRSDGNNGGFRGGDRGRGGGRGGFDRGGRGGGRGGFDRGDRGGGRGGYDRGGRGRPPMGDFRGSSPMKGPGRGNGPPRGAFGSRGSRGGEGRGGRSGGPPGRFQPY